MLKTIESNRYVTGVTWVEGELWHGTFEEGVSELRRVRPDDGEVLTRLEMPAGTMVSGLEWDGGELFYCGGGKSGKLRAVKRPSRQRQWPPPASGMPAVCNTTTPPTIMAMPRIAQGVSVSL